VRLLVLWDRIRKLGLELRNLPAQLSDVDAVVGFADAVIVLGGDGERHVDLAAEEHSSPLRNQPVAALAFDLSDESPIAQFLEVRVFAVREVELALRRWNSLLSCSCRTGFNKAGDETRSEVCNARCAIARSWIVSNFFLSFFPIYLRKM
jgi:hypothetical protein